MDRLVLASASPRRAQLLRQIGIDFEQSSSCVEEGGTETTDPKNLVVMLSRKKAEEVVRKLSVGWVLGADTVVVLDERILGKPADGSAAVDMLRSLSGREHRVLTGLTLIEAGRGRTLSRYEETRVWLRSLSDEDIEGYVATGEPLGKAGGYAIQGLGATLIERISGCYYNVVGLPLVCLVTMLREVGFPYRWKTVL